LLLTIRIGQSALKHDALITAQDGQPPKLRFWAIVAVGVAVCLTVIDQMVVNVALPTIGAELSASPSATVWIVNAYQVAIMLPLLPLSSAGDIFGYRRVYLAGLALFGLASIGCALATSIDVLVLMRVIQGLGAAGVMSVNMALVRFIHPIHRLGYGIGINAVIIAISAAAGPTLASAILAVADWPWLFWVKVPFAFLAFAIGLYTLPKTPRASHPFDSASAALSAITFGALIFFIDALGHDTPPLLVAAELLVTILAGLVLVRRQFSVPAPLLPIDLLRLPIFALSVATSMCSFLSQTLAFIALPFYMQAIGYSAVEVGLLMTPWLLATAALAPIAGRLSDRYPAGVLGLIGLLAFAAGLMALVLVDERTSTLDMVWRMALAGAGFGLYQSPNNRTMQASAPRHRSGGASGMQAMARLLGQTVGAALTAFAFARFADGSIVAMWLAVAFAVLGAVVSALRLTDMPRL
jgi:DHA2 family multidrug resistance protein-like MFS transporter